MSAKKYDFILTIDQGSHASRAALYDFDGVLAAHASFDISTSRIHSNGDTFIQHDVSEIEYSIQSILKQCQRQIGNHYIPKLKIKAGFATQRSTIVSWNFKTGDILSEVISWQDTRGSSFIKNFSNKRASIQNITGLFLSAHYGVSKIKWCLENIDAVKNTLNKNELCIAPLSSYLLYRFSRNSKCVVDHANAARTLLMNRHGLNWDETLLELFSIPKTILPKCVSCKNNYGQLQNWQGPCDIQLSTGDQSAAVFSQGRPKNNEFTVNIGSGAFILILNDSTESDTRFLSASIYTYYSERKLTKINAWEGTVNGAGIAIDWLQAQFPEHDLYSILAVSLDKANDNIPLFINGISGVGSPYWRASQRSYFIGESNLESKVVAVVESIVFLITINIKNMSVQVENSIKVTGGLSVSDGVCQKLADLNAMIVRRISDQEATQQGLFYLLSDCKKTILISETKVFNPEVNHSLLNRFNHWQKEMEYE